MLLPKFDFHEPLSLAEACQMMREFGRKARPLAGGTDLMVNMKKKILSPDHLVSLSRIDELKSVECSDSLLKIGACVTVAELAESEAIRKHWSAVCTGAKALGSPLIRNLATIGGNIASARPAADLPPSLMAYNAKVLLKKSSGERIVPLDDFFKGPGLTELQADEILTEIRIETPPPYSGCAYINMGVRKTQDCNIINVASFISLDSPDGLIKTARIVMGCVGPKHLRACSAEASLIGKKASEAIFAQAGELAMKDCSPIDDFRGSAEYKRAMVAVLTKRTLATAYKEVRNEK